MTDQEVKQIAKVLSQTFAAGKPVGFIEHITAGNRTIHKFKTNHGQEIDVSIINNLPNKMTISTTCYHDEYWDEGLGTMAGGNSSTCQIVFNKKGLPDPRLTFR